MKGQVMQNIVERALVVECGVHASHDTWTSVLGNH